MINEMLPSKASNLADVRCFTQGQTETMLQKLVQHNNVATSVELKGILALETKDQICIAINNLIKKLGV